MQRFVFLATVRVPTNRNNFKKIINYNAFNMVRETRTITVFNAMVGPELPKLRDGTPRTVKLYCTKQYLDQLSRYIGN
jgi:hypothetical protein